LRRISRQRRYGCVSLAWHTTVRKLCRPFRFATAARSGLPRELSAQASLHRPAPGDPRHVWARERPADSWLERPVPGAGSELGIRASTGRGPAAPTGLFCGKFSGSQPLLAGDGSVRRIAAANCRAELASNTVHSK